MAESLRRYFLKASPRVEQRLCSNTAAPQDNNGDVPEMPLGYCGIGLV